MVVAGSEIEHCEDGGAVKPVDGLVEPGKWVFIFDSSLVEATRGNLRRFAWCRLFLDEQDWGAKWRLGGHTAFGDAVDKLFPEFSDLLEG